MNLTQQPTGTPTSPSSQDGLNTADTQCKNSKPTKADSTKGSGLQSGCGLKQPKQKKCKACRNEFVPTRPMQKVCCGDCAISLGNLKKAKRERKAVADDKKATREKLDAMKSKGRLVAEAQVAFNRYIRLRDAGLPCICCGQPMGEGVHGGAVDAGHYRSPGSAPHLRFSESNVHAQRKQCNRYGSGNVVGYRLGLIERIGLVAVEALEADNTPRKYSADDLRAIKATYQAKRLELEKKNDR